MPSTPTPRITILTGILFDVFFVEDDDQHATTQDGSADYA
jgi:hypothetical protein